jgi:hypothetical protein
MKIGNPHPAAALAVAFLALIAAVSGTAVAVVAGQNGDNLITKRTLSGDRLRLNTVTGKEVNESKLKTVPKANRAAHLPPLVWHNLTLLNDWENYNGTARPPAWAVDAQGVVHFRGAIDQSTPGSDVFARLPQAARPSVDLWLATDMVDASTGRIDLDSSGFMNVEATVSIADAQDFTNLDGITYTLR